MKLNQIINLHKGLTPLVVVILMFSYKNFSLPAYVYLSLHGTYGILWLLKERIFPDPYFKEKINLKKIVTSYEASAISSFSLSSPELYMLIKISEPPINSPFT